MLDVYKVVARHKDQKRLYKKHEYNTKEKYLKHGIEFAERMLGRYFKDENYMSVEHYQMNEQSEWVLLKVEKNYE